MYKEKFDIAVIGIGVDLPNSKNTEEYWDILKNGICCTSKFPIQRQEQVQNIAKELVISEESPIFYDGAYLNNINEFDYEYFKMSPKNASLIDPAQRIFMETVVRTIEDAGYSMESVRGAKIGNFVGYSANTFKDNYLYSIFMENKDLIQYSIIGNITALIPSRIAQLYDFRGPAIVIDTACSSSLVAVHEACVSIHNNSCDMALACGIKLQLMPINDMRFKLGIESSDDKTRVFDSLADGAGIGEGIGAVLLKPLKNAVKDKDRIYAIIKGSSINHDGTAMGLTAPNPKAQTEVITEAWQQANIDIDKIQYVEMHGTATSLGDPIEFQGLNNAFLQYTDKKQICAVGSVKSNFGHLYEAAGIVSFIKACLAVYKGVIPATLNFNSPNFKIALMQSALYINTENHNWEEEELNRFAGISAFGLSGTNCHVVIGGYKNEKEIIDKSKIDSKLLFCFSAHSLDSLNVYLHDYVSYLKNIDSDVTFEQLSFCTNLRCNSLKYRLCIFANDFKALSENILLAINKVQEKESYSENEIMTISIAVQLFIDTNDEFDENKISYKNVIITEVAKDFLEGHLINWVSVYKRKYNKIALPSYSFLPNKLWYEKNDKSEQNELYQKKWVSLIQSQQQKEYGNILILDFYNGIGAMLKDKIILECPNVLLLNTFQDTLKVMLEQLSIDMIIYCSKSIDEENSELDAPYEDIDNLFLLCKSIQEDVSTDIVVIGRNTYSINSVGDNLNPINSLMYGFGCCISKEKRLVHFKGIDIGSLADFEELYIELLSGCKDELVMLRNGVKYVEAIECYSSKFSKPKYSIHKDGVYLITGGMGGIGYEVAKYLVNISNSINVILIGRSKIYDSNHCNEYKEKLDQLKKINGNIEYIPCDITNADEMNRTFSLIYQKYHRLNGIFHVAGIAGGENLEQLTREKMHKVMAPKVEGTILLDKMTKDKELDFLILFSSIATVFYSMSLADYTAANSFLDAYAQYYNSARKGHCLVINWTTWVETGMAKDKEFTIDTLFKGMNSEKAINLLQYVLKEEIQNIIIGELNLEHQIALTLRNYPYQYSDEIEEKLKKLVSFQDSSEKYQFSSNVQYENNQKSKKVYSAIEKDVIQLCYELLGYENIDINKNFFELGADSITFRHLYNKLDSIYPGVLKITDLFMNPSVVQISKFIEDKAEPIEEAELDNLTDEYDTDIAVIGMAMKFPNADSSEEYWNNLINGIDTVKNIPKERKKLLQFSNLLYQNKEKESYKKASYINDIDKFDYGLFGISPNDAILMDPVSRIFLQCCWSALEDAGYGGNNLDDSNTGVFLGYSANLANMYSRLLYENDIDLFGRSLAINQISMMVSRISYIKNFHGPSLVIDTACSSSLVSVQTACENINTGKCDVALAGGASLMLMPYDNEMGVGYEASDCRTRAFCKDSNGSAIGEGVAVIVLKHLSDAIKDNDDIYAVIKGGAINQDGSSFGIAAPNLKAQSQVIQTAWKKANINPSDISYIETHGTGTILGDSIEIGGLQDAFSKYTDSKQFCAIGSVKNNFGHLNEASGMTGLIKVILMIKNRMLVPTIHNHYPNTAIDWINSSLYLPDSSTVWNLDKRLIAGISGFGMSGTNCHMVLEEAPKRKSSSSFQDTFYILFSAKTRETLFELIEKWSKYLADTNDSLDLISYTLCCGRMHLEHRIGFVVKNYLELKEKVNYLVANYDKTILKNDIYKGSYHIIPESKVVRNKGDITVKEKEELERKTADTIENCNEKGNEFNRSLLKAYVKGATIQWNLLFANFKGVTHLPTYPFAKNSVWIPFRETGDSYFHGKRWIEKKNIDCTYNGCDNILFIHWEDVDVIPIMEKLGESVSNLVEIILCEQKKVSENNNSTRKYFVNPKSKELTELFLSIKHFNSNKIVYIPKSNRKIDENNKMDLYYNTCFYVPIDIVKALCNAHYQQEISFFAITEMTFLITEQDKQVNPEYAILIGLARVMEQEFLTIKIGIVDVESLSQIQQICDEICNGVTKNFVIGIRSEKRFVEIIDDIEIDKKEMYQFDKQGTYLITGGTSGMGVEIALYLAQYGCKNIVLLSRKNPLLMQVKNDEVELQQRVKCLKLLDEMTENLGIYECDITDRDMLKNIIDNIHYKYGRIYGVFHCAGISNAGFILRKNREDFKKVLDVKIKGTSYLDQLTMDDNLDFMLLCSSALSYIGEVGQSDYVAANSFLDAFTEYRNFNNRNTYCINWVTWKETGMGVRHGINKDDITKVLTTEEALSKMFIIMNGTQKRIMIGKYNFQSKDIKRLANSRYTISERILQNVVIDEFDVKQNGEKKLVIVPHQDRISHEEKLVTNVKIIGKVENLINHTERNIANIYGKILGYQTIDLYDDFFKMGGDSIMILKMQEEIEKVYPNVITSINLFEYPTIESLASYINRSKKLNISQHDIETETNVESKVKKSEYPLTFAQKRILFEERKNRGKKFYNNPFAFTVSKERTVEQLTQYMKILIERHQSLRVSFQLVNGNMRQIIHDDVDIIVDYVDCTNVLDYDMRDYLYSFDLAKAPLFHVSLIETAENRIFMFDAHHIILDGLSTRILIKEIAQLFTNIPLEPIEYQYSDYIELEQRISLSKQYAEAEKYWESIAKEIKPCNLIGDCYKTINSPQSYKGLYRSISKELEKKISEYAKNNQISLFTIYLGALYIAIHRKTNQDNITIGIVTLGRDDLSVMKVVGNFVNILPVTMTIPENMEINIFYKSLFKKIQDTFRYQIYPFNKISSIARKEYGVTELFNIMFEYENVSMNLFNSDPLLAKDEGRVCVIQQNGYRNSIDIKVNKYDNELIVYMNYDNTLFNDDYIIELFEIYKKVLVEIIK